MEGKIHLQIADKTFLLDRQELEKRIASEVANRFLGDNENPMARMAVKSAANTLMAMYGVQKPKGVDTLDFAAALIIKGVMDAVERDGLQLHAVEMRTVEAKGV